MPQCGRPLGNTQRLLGVCLGCQSPDTLHLNWDVDMNSMLTLHLPRDPFPLPSRTWVAEGQEFSQTLHALHLVSHPSTPVTALAPTCPTHLEPSSPGLPQIVLSCQPYQRFLSRCLWHVPGTVAGLLRCLLLGMGFTREAQPSVLQVGVRGFCFNLPGDWSGR